MCSVDYSYDEIQTKRRRRVKNLGVYEAERLIAQRKSPEMGNIYLVKWKGYSEFENTWEPEEHLSKSLLSYFQNPKPSEDIIQHYVDGLRRELLEALTHKLPEQTITLEFRHDVFKYLFHGKGEKRKEERNWTIYREEDFLRSQLPKNWNGIYDRHGDGVKIMFPIKMRTFLGMSPKGFHSSGNKIVEMPRLHTEKLSIKFVRITNTCRNEVA
ncbi:uncharacterized protein LOC116288732 [Actinia tenebrosa]|uniref:Uncharacterized protein LOC116288732 n=1 Tax=Actinia tenebrosa TaxID=6105 RepID=A0A6P8H7H6_ACTTE|nr:uncharacterized protein LOC116288732 [Actinia tenebrosa]